MRFFFATVGAAMLLAVGLAAAEHEDVNQQTRCGWASGGGNQAVSVLGTGTVYAGPNSGETGTNNGVLAVGYCSGTDSVPADGVLEVGVNVLCAYAVFDGDPSNPPDMTTLDGFVRVALPTCANPFTGVGGSGGYHP